MRVRNNKNKTSVQLLILDIRWCHCHFQCHWLTHLSNVWQANNAHFQVVSDTTKAWKRRSLIFFLWRHDGGVIKQWVSLCVLCCSTTVDGQQECRIVMAMDIDSNDGPPSGRLAWSGRADSLRILVSAASFGCCIYMVYVSSA